MLDISIPIKEGCDLKVILKTKDKEEKQSSL